MKIVAFSIFRQQNPTDYSVEKSLPPSRLFLALAFTLFAFATNLLAEPSYTLFESGQVRPLALSKNQRTAELP